MPYHEINGNVAATKDWPEPGFKTVATRASASLRVSSDAQCKLLMTGFVGRVSGLCGIAFAWVFGLDVGSFQCWFGLGFRV